MIDVETRARIRRLFYVEHWKIGTIARELGLHPETVGLAVETDRFNSAKTLRPSATDSYADFIRAILVQHPRLRATRIFQMIRDRGYNGSIVQLRRFVACIRPVHREAFLRLHTFPGEQGQVDWAHFGEVAVGRARRRLSCFVITLSYSRALYLEFFFDQRLESFLRGHIHAFEDWQGFPRILLCDNLRSVVLERRGDAIHFHPRYLELCAHYHFEARPCQVGAGNKRGALNESSGIYENPSLPPVHSQLWKISTDRLLNGATVKRITVRGRVMIAARWLRLSRKKGLGCCLCLHIDSILIFLFH